MQEVVSVSVWNMFMHSDAFMKTLIIIMCLASVWSWAIIIDKIRTFKGSRNGSQDRRCRKQDRPS